MLNVLGVSASAGAPSLPSLSIDPDGVTVSGVSSGGFMALQVAVAHSATVRGVGVVAAGPYYCARLDPSRILSVCLRGQPDWRDSVAAVDFAAQFASIDEPAHLQTLRAWVLADGADPVVAAAVVESTWNFLRHYAGPLARLERLAGAGHSMPTAGHGGSCSATKAPFLNDCGFDAAARMLDYLYAGPPAQSAAPPDAEAELVRFDQSEFVPAWRRWLGGASLDPTGYLYVPALCRKGGCRLHVALHGCRQGVGQGGETFVREAGYNAWAARHSTVVLYPQVRPQAPTWYAPWLAKNPEGCWDWWGYTGADYAVRSGVQVATIQAMIERLMGSVGR